MRKETQNIKKLIILSVLISISFVLAKWQLPMFPPYSFLKFDISESPLILSALIYPELTLLTALAYIAITYMVYDPIGATFKVIAVLSMIIPIGLCYVIAPRLRQRKWGQLLMLTIAILVRIAVMVGVNYYLLEIKHVMGNFSMPSMYYVLIIPIFNTVQALINALVAYLTQGYLKKIIGGEF